MKRIPRAAAVAVVAGALVTTALAGGVAPAQADTGVDVFLNELNELGLTGIDPATATRLGESVCPMLVEPGQKLADVAADVAESLGRPLGPATMFAGLAISVFCPGAVATLASGPVRVPLLGI